jgi:hypothetical protein
MQINSALSKSSEENLVMPKYSLQSIYSLWFYLSVLFTYKDDKAS